MKYGVREIADVVLKAKSTITLGGKTYYKDEPVLYFNTLKTSSLEGATTTVYAQGGRGNARLIAWEGEKTLTFNMEDALASIETLTLLMGSSFEEVKGLLPTKVEIPNQLLEFDGTITNVSNKFYYNKTTTPLATVSLKKCSKVVAKFSGNGLTNEQQEILRSQYGIAVVQGTTIVTSNNAMVGFDATPRLATRDTEAVIYLARLSQEDSEELATSVINIEIEITNPSGEFERVCIRSDAEITYVSSQQTKMTIPFGEWHCIYANFAEMMPLWIQPENQNQLFGGKSISQGQSSDFVFTGTGINMSNTPANAAKMFWSGPTIVSFYTPIYGHKSQRIMIDPDIFSTNFYLEANTLFRDTYGTDHPAIFVIPNCKIQSNFTLNMASTGDPSTFNFVLDAFPGYSRFDPTKKVLAILKLVEGNETEVAAIEFE